MRFKTCNNPYDDSGHVIADTAEAIIAAGPQAVLEVVEAGLANIQIVCETQHDPQALVWHLPLDAIIYSSVRMLIHANHHKLLPDAGSSERDHHNLAAADVGAE